MNSAQQVNNSTLQEVFLHNRKPFIRQTLLADANIPYNLAIDRKNNKLLFCINADEFSDQSFHSVVLDLKSGVPWIIEGIRDGFASAVDPKTGTVYLGGSDGIFKYNYDSLTVHEPVLTGVDILSMFFKDNLYFVDTAKQALSVLKENTQTPVKVLNDCLIQQFVVDGNNDIYFVNSSGLFILTCGKRAPERFPDTVDMDIRATAVDAYGRAHFITDDGIFDIDEGNRLRKLLSVRNGHGLALDNHNNVIYSDGRSLIRVCPLEQPTEYNYLRSNSF